MPHEPEGRGGHSQPATTRRRSARLRDVAAAAGVHVSVASRVLSGSVDVRVRPETRARIQAAAQQLRYRPNALGRGLRLQRTMTLAMIVPNLTGAVYFEIIRGAEREATKQGYVMLLADSGEFGRADEALRPLLYEGLVDGLIIASASNDDRVANDLAQQHLPYVVVNRRAKRLGPSVIEDDEAGIALGVRHLAGLGHRRIAHIAGPNSADTGRRRLEGFRSALRDLALPEEPGYVLSGQFTESAGHDAMARMLASPVPPTAVSSSSLAAAIGALAAVREAGLRVPHDISLVGFHDATIAVYLDPPLTTIQMPLGELAVRCLLQQFEGETLPDTTVVTTPPRLILRVSTAPPRSAH